MATDSWFKRLKNGRNIYKTQPASGRTKTAVVKPAVPRIKTVVLNSPIVRSEEVALVPVMPIAIDHVEPLAPGNPIRGPKKNRTKTVSVKHASPQTTTVVPNPTVRSEEVTMGPAMPITIDYAEPVAPGNPNKGSKKAAKETKSSRDRLLSLVDPQWGRTVEEAQKVDPFCGPLMRLCQLASDELTLQERSKIRQFSVFDNLLFYTPERGGASVARLCVLQRHTTMLFG